MIGSSYRAKQDTWISMLVASGLTLVLAWIVYRISRLYPGKDIFDLLKLCPKFLSVPLVFIVAYYCFEQAAMTLRVYTGFVHIVSLPNTGIIILPILTGLVVLFLINREDRMLFRFSYMTAIPIVFIILLLVVFLFPMFRLEHLFPVFYDNTKEVLLCSVENFSFPFGNIFLLLGIAFFPGNLKKERAAWLWIAVISGVLSLIVVLQNILLLGGELSHFLDFPYNYAASLVNVGDFFSRIEVFSSLFFFLSAIVRTAYFVRLTLRGIQSLCPVSIKSVSFPVVSLLCFYTVIAFDNTNSVFNYLKVFPYFALPLQIGLPIFLLWFCYKKNRENLHCYLKSKKITNRVL